MKKQMYWTIRYIYTICQSDYSYIYEKPTRGKSAVVQFHNLNDESNNKLGEMYSLTLGPEAVQDIPEAVYSTTQGCSLSLSNLCDYSLVQSGSYLYLSVMTLV